MNTVAFHLGGGKRFQDDTERVHQSANQGIEALVKGICGGPAIVYGCEVIATGPATRDVTAGYITDGTKLYRVNLTTVTGTDPYINFTLEINVVDTRTFADASVHDVHYFQTVAVGSSPTAGAADFDIVELPRLGNGIWQGVGLAGMPPFQGAWGNKATGGYYHAAYRHHLPDMVQMRGVVETATPVSGLTVFTLPVAYRPAFNVMMMTAYVDGSTPAVGYIAIGTAGAVSLVPAVGASGTVVFSLDNVQFSTRL